MKPFIAVLALLLFSCGPNEKKYDLILYNGKIWTGNKAQPWAKWIAIDDGKIMEVGESDTPPSGNQQIDLTGRLTVPGFNDSHVHFASAGHLLLNINLLDVNDEQGFVARVKETVSRLPSGSWITRGDWGAYEAWSMGSPGGDKKGKKFTPTRQLIDSITPSHPVLVTRYDRKIGLANSLALEFLGIESETGLLKGAELDSALNKIPEKSFDQRLAESKRAFYECRKWGVTTVQDMSPLDQLEVYKHLRKNNALTCRVNFSPSRLSDYNMMMEKGWTINWSDGNDPHPSGDEWISFGTLKTHIDGIMGARTAMFYEPYSDNSLENRFWRGSWREFSKDMPSFKKMIIQADASGIQMRIHSIGDLANAVLLDILDTLHRVNGEKERRFRLVHAQVISAEDFSKMKGKNIVAEVQPYHVTDDMRWMEERIGVERCKGAYAFRRLMENGCTLSFGSDWPGTNASYYPVNPLYGLYAAVTRQTVNGDPESGWFPDQKLTLEESLSAYTSGSSYGAFEEKRKGTFEPGKFADVAVLNTDLFSVDPSLWLKTQIDYTIVAGNIVYDRSNDDGGK